MKNLQDIQLTATRFLGRTHLVIKQYSPEILLGAGLIGGVTAAVLAARATLQLPRILLNAEGEVKVSKQAFEEGAIDEGIHTKNLSLMYIHYGLELIKLYGPSVGLGVMSVACILASHGVMKRREVAIVAAYNLLSEAFKSYRSRVVEDLGEEIDRDYYLGLRNHEVVEKSTDELGNPVKTKKKIKAYDSRFKSPYARFFDESSTQWQSSADLNHFFVKSQQNYVNDLLKRNGHVFLNEVYDALGMPRTKAGAVVGWIYESKDGDGFIDFGLNDIDNAPVRDFVNGYNPSVLLDFNVEGLIYNKI